MAAWYVGSVQHTAVAQFAITTAYSVGQIVRQLAAPAVGSERCFRCTTAGTSAGTEPTWNLGKGVTTTSGTAVFTEVTGNSTYAWAAASARLLLIYNTFSASGDTVYVAHNHAETQSTANTLSGVGNSASPVSVFCVNAAGSVPPVAADLATTGTVTTTGAASISIQSYAYLYGLTFSAGTGANSASINLNTPSGGGLIFQSCNLVLGTSQANSIACGAAANTSTSNTLINTRITFGAVGQSILLGSGGFTWLNTPSAIGGTVPTTLFTVTSGGYSTPYLDGVDLSAAGSGKTLFSTANATFVAPLVNCKLGAGVTVRATVNQRGAAATCLINSDSGATGYRQEMITYEGALTTETSFTRAGGASDGVAPISWKVITTANAKNLWPFACFQIAEWNTVTGSSVTATVEIESTAALTDADVWVVVEYLGSSATPVSSAVSSGIATPLTAAASLPTSSVTWNGALGSAVKQYLQVSFTPQMVGLVRATVYVGKASQTVYIDPLLTLA